MILRIFDKRLLALTWVALLLACVTTVDLVVDLVFEEPELSGTVGSVPLQEEADNSAEHILMPTFRADFAGSALLQVSAIVLMALYTLLSSLADLSGREHPYLIKSIKPPSTSSIQVLRI